MSGNMTTYTAKCILFWIIFFVLVLLFAGCAPFPKAETEVSPTVTNPVVQTRPMTVIVECNNDTR